MDRKTISARSRLRIQIRWEAEIRPRIALATFGPEIGQAVLVDVRLGSNLLI